MGTTADLDRALAALPDDEFRVIRGAGPLELEVEVRDAVWPRPREFDVLPSWRFSYGFRVQPPDERRVFLQRIGVRWSWVLTDDGIGTWEEGGEVEPEPGDATDCILREIENLRTGIARIRMGTMTAEALMAMGRNAKWEGDLVGDVVSNLEKRPAAELPPHVAELVDALLASGRFTIPIFDILAKAGIDAFRPIAERIYDYSIPRHRKYLVELLQKLGDDSERAQALIRD